MPEEKSKKIKRPWLWGISIAVISFVVAIFPILILSGLFTRATAHEETLTAVTAVYKIYPGPYQDAITQLPTIGDFLLANSVEQFRCFGVKDQQDARLSQTTIGCLIEDKAIVPLQNQLTEQGLQWQHLDLGAALVSTFPHKTPLSLFLADWKVWPQIVAWQQQAKNLMATQTWIIYERTMITYITPRVPVIWQ